MFAEIFKKIIASLFLPLLFLTGCNQMSEMKQDSGAGMNGGFEITDSGLPVNWLCYTEKTVKDGKFTIAADRDIFREGKQSLKLTVKSCSSTGGSLSPGLAQEFEAAPGAKYKLGFWIRNQGSQFNVSAGPVSAFTGNVKSLIKSDQDFNDWKYFEYVVYIPSDFQKLRFELNVLRPGTFWIDDFTITEIKG